MAQPQTGPFRYIQVSADTTITTKAAVLANYSVQNKSGAPVDVLFYDDPAGGAANPIEAVTVTNNVAQAIYPLARTEGGLGVKCSNWTSVLVSVRWAPK